MMPWSAGVNRSISIDSVCASFAPCRNSMYGWTDFRVRKGRQLIVMLGGGDKSTQERDIRVAHQRAT